MTIIVPVSTVQRVCRVIAAPLYCIAQRFVDGVDLYYARTAYCGVDQFITYYSLTVRKRVLKVYFCSGGYHMKYACV